MRVTVDLDLCMGHGQCLLAAPEVFDLSDETEQVVLLDPAPAEDQEPRVRRAASMCPAGAIKIQD
ncbi:ferredoxin [Actinocorallia sp. B10E7]|uniref:ferredoxin n=1 Tax=Actinocorallia sp. B10E7 TaxID=3153558 RepID=UPI00325D330D